MGVAPPTPAQRVPTQGENDSNRIGTATGQQGGHGFAYSTTSREGILFFPDFRDFCVSDTRKKFLVHACASFKMVYIRNTQQRSLNNCARDA